MPQAEAQTEQQTGAAEAAPQTPPGWTIAHLAGDIPEYARPAAFVFGLTAYAPVAALDQWKQKARESLEELTARFQAARDGSQALASLRRAEHSRKDAEQALAEARRRAARAKADIEAAIRQDQDPGAAEEAEALAERDIRRGEQRLKVIAEVEENQRGAARMSLECEIEAQRKRLQQETAARLAELDAAILSAIAPLLVDALVLRRDLALLAVPATGGFRGQSAFADMSAI